MVTLNKSKPKPPPSLKDMRGRNKKKKKGGINPSNMPKKLTPEEQIDLRTKRIKVKEIKPQFVIGNTGLPEGMRDALKIEGKPHSSRMGRFMSKMRSMPLKVVTFKKNGGKVKIAKRGGGRAYGKNS